MDDEEWVEVTYIDGPHDGREGHLPNDPDLGPHEGQRLREVSPYELENRPAPPSGHVADPGPTEQYVLHFRDDRWVAVWDNSRFHR
jgi:hypothetical protein